MISMRGVNKHFGSQHVLKDINFDVGRGQVVVVLGPSGSLQVLSWCRCTRRG
jgi:glutamate transport system ATP-binding protein